MCHLRGIVFLSLLKRERTVVQYCVRSALAPHQAPVCRKASEDVLFKVIVLSAWRLARGIHGFAWILSVIWKFHDV